MDKFYNDILNWLRNLTDFTKIAIIGILVILTLCCVIGAFKGNANAIDKPVGGKFKIGLIILTVIFAGLAIWVSVVMW